MLAAPALSSPAFFYLNPMVLTGLDHDAHVSASAAAQALSRRSIPSVHALHAKRTAADIAKIFALPLEATK
jgi:hypothetical protein